MGSLDFNGRWELPIEKQVPIDTLEPLVLPNIISSAFQITQTFCSICSEKSLDQIFCIGVEMRWKDEFSSQNLFINPKWVLIIKWREPIISET